MSRRARVLGRGLAGAACARLLVRHGWHVRVSGPEPRYPALLLLNETTCALLQALCGNGALLDGFHLLTERVVHWGSEPPAILPLRGRVIRGDLLLARLWERLGALDTAASETADEPFDWTIFAGGRGSDRTPAPGDSGCTAFGRRSVVGATVTLVPTAPSATCLMESTPEGWLFLTPLGGRSALLQGMLPSMPEDPSARLAELMARSVQTRRWVAEIVGSAYALPAAPRLLVPPCGPDWIAVGDAAAAFDPVCGDGTGFALRGAILAAGILDGIDRGLPGDRCLEHYGRRVRTSMRAHLRECSATYSRAGLSHAWDSELAALWMPPLRGNERPFEFGLRGFQLVPL